MTVFGGDIIYAADLNAALNRHVCKLVAQSAQTIPDNTDTVLTFGSGSEEIDTDGWHSEITDTGLVTVDRDGLYLVIAQVVYAFSTALEYADVGIRLNGTVGWRSGNFAPTTTNNVSKSGGRLTETIEADAGDDFSMSAMQNSTANASRDTNTGTAGVRFTVLYLGPKA